MTDFFKVNYSFSLYRRQQLPDLIITILYPSTGATWDWTKVNWNSRKNQLLNISEKTYLDWVTTSTHWALLHCHCMQREKLKMNIKWRRKKFWRSVLVFFRRVNWTRSPNLKVHELCSHSLGSELETTALLTITETCFPIPRNSSLAYFTPLRQVYFCVWRDSIHPPLRTGLSNRKFSAFTRALLVVK